MEHSLDPAYDYPPHMDYEPYEARPFRGALVAAAATFIIMAIAYAGFIEFYEVIVGYMSR